MKQILSVLAIIIVSLSIVIGLLLSVEANKPEEIKFGNVVVVTQGFLARSKLVVLNHDPVTDSYSCRLVEYRGNNHEVLKFFGMNGILTVSRNDIEDYGTFAEYFIKMVQEQQKNKLPK